MVTIRPDKGPGVKETTHNVNQVYQDWSDVLR
jgi:hypothetical protein